MLTRFFHPSFAGVYKPGILTSDLLGEFATRVRSGRLFPSSPARNTYRIIEQNRDRIRFQAADFLTAFFVGLNDVSLELRGDGIHYRVSYWKWAAYCAALGGFILVALVACLLVWPRIVTPPTLPNQAIFYGNAVFWGLAWPWILIAFHKRPAARCLERLLDETNKNNV